jgi:iron(III) transport system substrate-binding protein
MRFHKLFFGFVSTCAVSFSSSSLLALSADNAAPAATFDAGTQAQFDAAKKVIPGLTPDVFEGAKKEGAVNLYRLGYDFPVAMFPEFQKLFPFVKIVEYEAVASALIQRYSAEAHSGRASADIVMGTLPTAFDQLDSEGLIAHYKPTLADHFTLGSRDRVYYPIGRAQVCNAYNIDRVSEQDAKLLDSWDGITNPRWKGKAAIVRYGTGGVGILPYYFMDTVKGPDFTKVVMAQRPLVFNSVPVMSERLAAGGIDTIFFANDVNLYQLERLGAPIRWTCPEPGLVLFTTQIIGYKAPHPNAAKLWIEFTLSDYGQQLVMSTLGFGAGRTDIPDIRPFASQTWYKSSTAYFNFTWNDILKHQDDLRAKWTALSNGLTAGD